MHMNAQELLRQTIDCPVKPQKRGELDLDGNKHGPSIKYEKP